MLIGIIDYGACNIVSVYNAFYRLGIDPKIIKNPEEIVKCDKIVVPGVGSASSCIKSLHNSRLFSEIKNFYDLNRPILGICLGLQIFSKILYEDGISKGLEIINANVEKLNIKSRFNIGWCPVSIEENIAAKIDLNKISNFYFCHSYYLKFKDDNEKKFCVGSINEVEEIPSLIIKNSFLGCQFHPEKSQKSGEKILKYFLKY